MSFQPPKGTFDVVAGSGLPVGDPSTWRELLRQWEEIVEVYGYPLAMSPVFEATELFERGVGETTEVVNKEMYTFVDKGGRSITLRPEGTAGMVRAYLNTGAQGAWKGAYSGPMFRYERPQKGRYRQFWQVGVEYVDVEGPSADAEVIDLGYRYLSQSTIPGLEIRINSLGCKRCRPGYLAELRRYLLARQDSLSVDSQELIETNPMRVLDSKVDGPGLTDAPVMSDYLCDECRSHHEAVLGHLQSLGVPFVPEPRLVRGLDYYTRTAFEYIATKFDAAQNAVGGGGRYDGLAESIGGRRAPGIGFALGIDRMILAMSESAARQLDMYLVSETTPGDALAVASILRAHGVSVDFDTEDRSVKAQFRSASRSGAIATGVVNDDTTTLDVRSGQDRITLAVEDVRSWLEGRAS